MPIMTAAKEIPLQITFREIGPSAAIERRIRTEAAKLGRFQGRMIGCNVLVSSPHRHRRKGVLYSIRIQLVLPGGSIWINRGAPLHQAHQDIYVAIRDAFAAATRRLEDRTRRLSGQVKQHEIEPHGIVTRLFPDQGYGFIRTPSEDEIYFHRHAVLNRGFGRLKEGAEVRFVVADQEGDKGPQASTVRIVGKHHLPPR
jgi:cold shock CspA family protein